MASTKLLDQMISILSSINYSLISTNVISEVTSFFEEQGYSPFCYASRININHQAEELWIQDFSSNNIRAHQTYGTLDTIPFSKWYNSLTLSFEESFQAMYDWSTSFLCLAFLKSLAGCWKAFAFRNKNVTYNQSLFFWIYYSNFKHLLLIWISVFALAITTFVYNTASQNVVDQGISWADKLEILSLILHY